MSFLKFIITYISLINLTVVYSKKELMTLEISVPAFLNSLLGVDNSVKSFRATIGSNKDYSDTNDLEIALTARKATSSDDNKIHKRVSHDENIMRFNIKGANDVVTNLQSALKPLAGAVSQSLLQAVLSGALRRSQQEIRPNVELAPGALKTEILTYPPNFLGMRLKHLLKIKEKEELREKKGNIVKETKEEKETLKQKKKKTEQKD